MKIKNININKKKALAIALCSVVLLSGTNLVACKSDDSVISDSTIDTVKNNSNEEIKYCLVGFGNNVELLEYKRYNISKTGVTIHFELQDESLLNLAYENVIFVDQNSKIQVDLANEMLASNNQEETIPYQKKKICE